MRREKESESVVENARGKSGTRSSRGSSVFLMLRLGALRALAKSFISFSIFQACCVCALSRQDDPKAMLATRCFA